MPTSTRSVMAVILLSLAGPVLSGCQTEANLMSGTTGFESVAIPGASSVAAYDAALGEVRLRYGGAKADAESGTIVSLPQYLAGVGRAGELRVVSTPSQGRRVATVRVKGDEGVVRVEVCVAVERRETALARQYESIGSQQDVPSKTPIETGAVLPPDRTEVWTSVSRDHEKETELLDAIQRRLTGASPPPTPK